MPRSREQLEKIKQQKKLQILQAALELFARQGFHATSVDQIARHAGVSKGLIYNYFTSKQDLLVAIINSIFAEMDKAFPDVDPQSLSSENLENYILTSMQAIELDPQLLRLYFMLYMQPDVESIVKPMVQQYLDKIVEFLSPYYHTRGIENPRPIVLGLIAALDGLSLHYILLGYPEFKDILKTLIKKFIYV